MWSVPGVWRHGAGGDPPPMPQCVGLSCRFSGRAGRLEGVRVFSGTAGTCRVRVRNPGRGCGRLGGGVVAIMPRYGAYVTLSRAPRETAVFPVHCLHRITSGRYASAAYHPAGGGTTDNMARIPGGGFPGMLRYVAVRPRRYSSVRYGSLWFAMLRFGVVAMRHYAPVRGVSAVSFGNLGVPGEDFFCRSGRFPGAGARIRAGAGAVTAPGVPLTAAYCPGRGTYGPAAGPGVPGALYRPGYMPAGRREERLPHPAINV